MIYYNAHEIIGWYTSKGKNNVEKGTPVTADASYVGTIGGSILEREVNMAQGTHLPIISHL